MSDDFLDGLPSVSKTTALVAGVLLPACIAVYAAAGLFRHAIYFPGRHHTGVVVKGDLAVWLSLVYLSLAAVVHFHLFWGSRAGLWRYRGMLVLLSLLCFCACLGTFIFRFMAN